MNCPTCKTGELLRAGYLGVTEWYRCRHCGAYHSNPEPAERDEETASECGLCTDIAYPDPEHGGYDCTNCGNHWEF